ncbi:MAG: RNA-binding S4 domain-containing protein [Sphingomonadaceae bacterium]
MRVNGRVVARPARQVMPGDILVFALRGRVRVLRILALPDRRGPAGEARACYAEIAPVRGAGGVDEPTGRGLGQERRGGA